MIIVVCISIYLHIHILGNMNQERLAAQSLGTIAVDTSSKHSKSSQAENENDLKLFD